MKKPPSTPSIVRRSAFASPKVELVVACEGKNTERRYLEDCKSEYGAGLVKLRFLPITGVPLTVVNAAIEERQRLIAQRNRSKDSFDVFRVWAVFDRDAHPNVDEALSLAEENKIDVAYSNPCFEIWPLLHLIDYGAQDGRHAVQARLREEMPNYDHDKGAIVDFQLIKDAFPTAYERARVHNSARVVEGAPRGCPSTTVGELVKKMAENGKCVFARRQSHT
ncbi:RloB family protein [Paucibacter sp. B51]|uniref:RloB family protein n=1 Tax=Paucibacter sp. B51 TaxID=2993315 RepID=UPI0022EBBF76|nr:RloB family protein [Paucibacter sp. B51]